MRLLCSRLRRTLATPLAVLPVVLVLAGCLNLSLAVPAANAQPTTSGSTRAPVKLDKQDESLPLLVEPINDFATLIDESNRRQLDHTARALQSATGDAIVVVTVPTYAPYGSIQEYANKLYANHGRSIGEKGKDNGLLVVVAQQERKVWVEVGYGLEGIITDGFAGETSRQYMSPYFKQGQFGAGLNAGVNRFVARIAEERHATLPSDAIASPQTPPRDRSQQFTKLDLLIVLFFVIVFVVGFISRLVSDFRGPGSGGRGRGGWSGWSSGVGGFGGGWGGGFGGGGGGGWGGGGGGGGSWGGFGGGSSGGGGGGASW